MESLVTGCEDGSVSLFDHSETTYENGTLPYTAPPVLRALVTRADLGLAIRAVKFSPNGTRVAVASDELKVKVVDVRDTTKMQLLDGHTKAVRKVAWSPDGQLIVCVSRDYLRARALTIIFSLLSMLIVYILRRWASQDLRCLATVRTSAKLYSNPRWFDWNTRSGRISGTMRDSLAPDWALFRYSY